jgi:hypothetical protein
MFRRLQVGAVAIVIFELRWYILSFRSYWLLLLLCFPWSLAGVKPMLCSLSYLVVALEC